MKMKKNLHTSFIKFLIEKYTDETEKEPQQEHEGKTKEKENLIKMSEIEDEDEDEDNWLPLPDDDDEVDNIQELLKEYKRLKKKNENNKVFNRRR